MHASFLAFESVFAGAIVFLNLAIGTGIVTAYKARPRYTWLLVAGFALLSVYFAQLTITTGTAPMVGRVALALPIRVTLVIGLVAFVIWGVCLMTDMKRNGRIRSSISYRLALLTSFALLVHGASLR